MLRIIIYTFSFKLNIPYAFPDRTLSLLKAGAKTLAHKLNTSAQMDSMELPCPSSPCKFRSTSSLKQMLLTDKLQLKLSDKIINVGCRTALTLDCRTIILLWHCDYLFFFQDVQVDLCGCGRLIDRSMSACYYCDQTLCSSCQSMCAICTELFCQNCSLPV